MLQHEAAIGKHALAHSNDYSHSPSRFLRKDDIKAEATGRWSTILRVEPSNAKTGCPKCGKQKFWTRSDFASTGGCGCYGCDKVFADGIGAYQWIHGVDFRAALLAIRGILGGFDPRPVTKPAQPQPTLQTSGKEGRTPVGLCGDFADWQKDARAKKYSLVEFAKSRKLSIEALSDFGARLHPNGVDVVFPERWPAGNVSSEVRRFAQKRGDQRYKSGFGHSRQFCFLDRNEWCNIYPLVLIAEGVFDAVAGRTGGVDVIARHTKDTKLIGLAPLLRDLDRSISIVVMIENDEDVDEGSIEKKAIQLAKAMLRDVFVCRYPPEVNDLNDWIVYCKAKKIHQYEAGRKLVAFVKKNARAVDWSAEIIEANKAIAEQKVESALNKFTVKRLERQEVGSRCGFWRTHQRDKQGDTQYRSSTMLCSKWTCSTCRPRLKMAWYSHLLPLLNGEPIIYATEITCESITEVESKLASIRKSIQRKRGRWACVRMLESNPEPNGNTNSWERAVILSTCPTVGYDDAFDLRVDGVRGHFATYFAAIIEQANHLAGRPIRCTPQWSRSEKPTFEHWRLKLAKIQEKPDVSYGMVTKADGLAIRRECAIQKRNYIGVRLGDLELIFTDLVGVQLPQASNLDVEVAAEDFFASGGWRAKPTKGWSPLEIESESGEVLTINCGPKRLAEAAKHAGVKCSSFGPNGVESAVETTLVAISQQNKNLKEKFLEAFTEEIFLGVSHFP